MQKPPQHASDRFGQWMIYAAWVVFLALLTIAFNAYLDRQNNPNQSLAFTKNANGVAEIVLTRNRYGHYVADGTINGSQVTFLIDTGASLISIPASVAHELGLPKGAAYPVRTANGTAIAYRTTLERVTLGAIRAGNLRASINPTMHGREVLLGMNFMKELEMIQRGNRLILRRY